MLGKQMALITATILDSGCSF